MAVEYGVFNAEGLIEGDFWLLSDALAEAEILRHSEDDESAYAARVCEQCREHEADTCEPGTSEHCDCDCGLS